MRTTDESRVVVVWVEPSEEFAWVAQAVVAPLTAALAKHGLRVVIAGDPADPQAFSDAAFVGLQASLEVEDVQVVVAANSASRGLATLVASQIATKFGAADIVAASQDVPVRAASTLTRVLGHHPHWPAVVVELPARQGAEGVATLGQRIARGVSAYA